VQLIAMPLLGRGTISVAKNKSKSLAPLEPVTLTLVDLNF